MASNNPERQVMAEFTMSSNGLTRNAGKRPPGSIPFHRRIWSESDREFSL